MWSSPKKKNLLNLTTAIQRRAPLNNIHPLNFHRAFLGPHFVHFLVYFRGSKRRCPDATRIDISFFPLSCHAIQCAVSIIHAVLIYECMMFDCAESTQRVFVWNTARRLRSTLTERRVRCLGMVTFVIHGLGEVKQSLLCFLAATV